MEIITLREEYIKLGQALKAAGLVDSGVEAKYAVEEGKVKVNGQTALQRGKNFLLGIWWNFADRPLKLKREKRIREKRQ